MSTSSGLPFSLDLNNLPAIATIGLFPSLGLDSPFVDSPLPGSSIPATSILGSSILVSSILGAPLIELADSAAKVVKQAAAIDARTEQTQDSPAKATYAKNQEGDRSGETVGLPSSDFEEGERTQGEEGWEAELNTEPQETSSYSYGEQNSSTKGGQEKGGQASSDYEEGGSSYHEAGERTVQGERQTGEWDESEETGSYSYGEGQQVLTEAPKKKVIPGGPVHISLTAQVVF